MGRIRKLTILLASPNFLIRVEFAQDEFGLKASAFLSSLLQHLQHMYVIFVLLELKMYILYVVLLHCTTAAAQKYLHSNITIHTSFCVLITFI